MVTTTEVQPLAVVDPLRKIVAAYRLRTFDHQLSACIAGYRDRVDQIPVTTDNFPSRHMEDRRSVLAWILKSVRSLIGILKDV